MNLSLNTDPDQEIALNPINPHLIQEFYERKTPEEIEVFNTKKLENHEEIDETEEKKLGVDEKIEEKRKENRDIQSSVVTCLNIKRLVMHLQKFNTPILKKNKENDLSQKTQEKTSFFQEKNSDFQERNADFKEKNAIFKEKNTDFQEKNAIFQEKFQTFIQKTEEKKIYSENICIIMKTEESKHIKSKQRSVNLKIDLSEVSPFQKYEFFMRMMNFSNNITSPIVKNQANYKVFIGKGNNRTLIKTLMKNRLFFANF